MYSLELDVISL